LGGEKKGGGRLKSKVRVRVKSTREKKKLMNTPITKIIGIVKLVSDKEFEVTGSIRKASKKIEDKGTIRLTIENKELGRTGVLVQDNPFSKNSKRLETRHFTKALENGTKIVTNKGINIGTAVKGKVGSILTARREVALEVGFITVTIITPFNKDSGKPRGKRGNKMAWIKLALFNRKSWFLILIGH